MNKTLDEYINEVITFYGNRIPNTVDEALRGNKPKYFTYKSIKKYFGINLLELLDKIHERVGHTKSTAIRKMVKLEDQILDCGLELLSTTRENAVTMIRYRCTNCSKIHSTNASTLKKWHNTSTKFCPDCRGSVKRSAEARLEHFSAMLAVSEYQDFVSVDSILQSSGSHGRLLLKFHCCGNTKEYNTSTLGQMVKDGAAFKCDYCSYPVSAMETYVENLLSKHFTCIDMQVPYSVFAECSSHWKVDFLINRKYLIEVTTGLTDKAEYSNNISQKIEWAESNDIRLFIITNLFQVEDIVRSILKDIEEGNSEPSATQSLVSQ